MKVSPDIFDIIKMLCKVIKEKRLLYFYYESDSGKKWRKIRPYMIIPNTKENLELVGLPIEELKQTDKEKRPAGHYLLEKLDMNRFEILDETFSDPGVPRNIVVITQKSVGCRFIYDDEDDKKTMKSWLKIEVIKPMPK